MNFLCPPFEKCRNSLTCRGVIEVYVLMHGSVCWFLSAIKFICYYILYTCMMNQRSQVRKFSCIITGNGKEATIDGFARTTQVRSSSDLIAKQGRQRGVKCKSVGQKENIRKSRERYTRETTSRTQPYAHTHFQRRFVGNRAPRGTTEQQTIAAFMHAKEQNKTEPN